MADKTCTKELNAQLQVLRSRMDTLEENVKSNIMSQIETLIATMVGMALIPDSGAALVSMLANPYVAALAAGLVSGGVDGWKQILGLFSGITDFNELFARMMLDQLGLPSYPGAITSNLEGAISAEIYAQQQVIADLIREGAPIEEILAAQALLQEIQDAYDSLISATGCQNKLSLCKTASAIINVV